MKITKDKWITFRVSEDFHKAVAVLAAQQGKYMSRMIKDLIQKELEKAQ